MNVVYDHQGRKRDRRKRRADRCRYHVEAWYIGQYRSEGVHRFKFIAVTHAWLWSVLGDYNYRVIDTEGGEDD